MGDFNESFTGVSFGSNERFCGAMVSALSCKPDIEDSNSNERHYFNFDLIHFP